MKEKCDKTKCPFLNSPFPDCYCSQLTSQATDKVIKYCVGTYEECDIYRQHLDT
ncbi:MAG: hypothetical protein HZB62_08760 [Nitrospirae bacterium]|nr:hypothetical protein [Nitrospirota bacterium]